MEQCIEQDHISIKLMVATIAVILVTQDKITNIRDLCIFEIAVTTTFYQFFLSSKKVLLNSRISVLDTFCDSTYNRNISELFLYFAFARHSVYVERVNL